MRIAAIAFALLALPLAAAAPLPLDAPLIADGDIRVDAGDVEGFMLRIPVERRAEARSSSERIANYADALFVARSFAARARQAGLDKDPIAQRRLVQAQDSVLADLYLQHAEKSAAVPNLETRARELYAAEQDKFTSPEQVHIQHILIGPQWRTREMAQERAQKVYEEAKAGEDFLSLAARYSDDPDKKRNGGDLGYNSPTSFTGPVRQAIDAMSKKGELSPPIESAQGFHIVRFIDRKKPELAKFEDVKRNIIGAERERLIKKSREDALASVRDSKTVIVHRDNLKGMVTTVDDVLKRASAADAAPPTPNK
jgi:parvulin-like peptidyl-prolyl isomerase